MSMQQFFTTISTILPFSASEILLWSSIEENAGVITICAFAGYPGISRSTFRSGDVLLFAFLFLLLPFDRRVSVQQRDTVEALLSFDATFM